MKLVWLRLDAQPLVKCINEVSFAKAMSRLKLTLNYKLPSQFRNVEMVNANGFLF